MFDLDSIKNGEPLTEESLKDLWGNKEKRELSEDSEIGKINAGNKPAERFNSDTMRFEAVDVEIRKLRERREQLKRRNDPLESKQIEIKQGLQDIDLPLEQMGKTGDSGTGKVTEEQKKIAESQTEDAKMMMLHNRSKTR